MPLVRLTIILTLILGFVSLAALRLVPAQAHPDSDMAECDPLGWFPEDFGLKDHSVFWFDGYYYLVAIYVSRQTQFAYARSVDMCVWEEMSPILTEHSPGSWDEVTIWAPYVWEEGGVFYMVYTGVTRKLTQSIMLATSTNPADPLSWETHGMIFQPDHKGMLWEEGRWADCRDPTVLVAEETYYLYYTGMDIDGGIVGLATSTTTPYGPWKDWGRTILPLSDQAIPESPTITIYDGVYYLFYNDSSQGEIFRIGASPSGPWESPEPFRPGWAHEVWQIPEGEWYTSYLTDYAITISPLIWDSFFSPARPFIGDEIYHFLIPMVLLQE